MRNQLCVALRIGNKSFKKQSFSMTCLITLWHLFNLLQWASACVQGGDGFAAELRDVLEKQFGFSVFLDVDNLEVGQIP